MRKNRKYHSHPSDEMNTSFFIFSLFGYYMEKGVLSFHSIS